MTAALRLLLDAAATYRLTKLVTHDTLTVEARDAVVRWAYGRSGLNPAELDQPALIDGIDLDRPGAWSEDVVQLDPSGRPPKLATLVTCSWCAGFWVALGVAVARRLAPRSWAFAAEVLALAAAAGLASERLQK